MTDILYLLISKTESIQNYQQSSDQDLDCAMLFTGIQYFLLLSLLEENRLLN